MEFDNRGIVMLQFFHYLKEKLFNLNNSVSYLKEVCVLDFPISFEWLALLGLYIQLCSKLYIRLLHKPYVNEVTLTGQNLSSKCY